MVVLGSYNVRRSLSQTTAKYATCYRAAIDIDIRFLVFCVSQGTSRWVLGCIHCTKGTTAIYVTCYAPRSAEGTTVVFGTDVHHYIAANNR